MWQSVDEDLIRDPGCEPDNILSPLSCLPAAIDRVQVFKTALPRSHRPLLCATARCIKMSEDEVSFFLPHRKGHPVLFVVGEEKIYNFWCLWENSDVTMRIRCTRKPAGQPHLPSHHINRPSTASDVHSYIFKSRLILIWQREKDIPVVALRLTGSRSKVFFRTVGGSHATRDAIVRLCRWIETLQRGLPEQFASHLFVTL